MTPNPHVQRGAARLLLAILALAASVSTPAQRVTPHANDPAPVGRLISFPANASVQVELKSHRDGPIPSQGWKPKFRFAGQADLHDCAFEFRQIDALLLREQRRSGTIRCTTAWKVDDANQTFEVFENGAKVAEGKLVH